MRYLIVHAHPDTESFNAALTQAAVNHLRALGHAVQVSDLYALGWNPVLGAADFPQRVDTARLRVAYEQTHAVETGTQSADVAAEQEKVLWADVVVFQFPLWWFGPPAILKGWVDRVFARGFAYLSGRKYDTGMLAGRVGVVCVTTGTSADTYAPDGIDGSLLDHLWPIHNGVFRYTGFEVAEPFLVHMPGQITDQERSQVLDTWAQTLAGIADAPRLFFHPQSDYDERERLKPEVEPRSGFQHRP